MDDLERTLTQSGLVCRVGGEVAYTPRGKKLKTKVEETIKQQLGLTKAEEVELPTLVDYSKLKLDRRIFLARYFYSFRTLSQDKTLYLLARTAEELAVDYFSRSAENGTTKGLIYQIKTKFRDEDSKELDFLRRREFTMLDAYSFDANLLGSQRTYQEMKQCFGAILNKLGIPHITKTAEDVCANVTSEEFLCELEEMNGVELGHIYQLGNLYTKPYGLEHVMMGSYGLGIDRLFAAVAIIRRKNG